MNWFKWHWTNLKFKLAASTGKFKTYAREDCEKMKHLDSPWQVSAYEQQIGNEYREFSNFQSDSITRMNYYFLLIFAAAVAIVVRSYFNLSAAVDQYLLHGAVALAIVLLCLFLFELLRGKYRIVTQAEYNEAKNWIHHISEGAKRSKPWWIWLLLIFALALESAAISIIASSYISDLTKNESLYIGIVIGVAGAFVLTYFVEKAGENLYRAHKRKIIDRLIAREEGMEKSKTYQELKKTQTDFLLDQPGFIKNYGYLILAIALVAGISISAFYQRASLNKNIIQMQTGLELSGIDAALLPGKIKQQQTDSRKNEVQEASKRAERGMYAALTILTIIFIGINALGCSLGYKYAFYNEHSKKAYQDIAAYKRQANINNQDEVSNSRLNTKVANRANLHFSKYYQHLIREAPVFSDKLAQNLNTRGPMTLVKFFEFDTVKNQQELKSKTGWSPQSV